MVLLSFTLSSSFTAPSAPLFTWRYAAATARPSSMKRFKSPAKCSIWEDLTPRTHQEKVLPPIPPLPNPDYPLITSINTSHHVSFQHIDKKKQSDSRNASLTDKKLSDFVLNPGAYDLVALKSLIRFLEPNMFSKVYVSRESKEEMSIISYLLVDEMRKDAREMSELPLRACSPKVVNVVGSNFPIEDVVAEKGHRTLVVSFKNNAGYEETVVAAKEFHSDSVVWIQIVGSESDEKLPYSEIMTREAYYRLGCYGKLEVCVVPLDFFFKVGVAAAA